MRRTITGWHSLMSAEMDKAKSSTQVDSMPSLFRNSSSNLRTTSHILVNTSWTSTQLNPCSWTLWQFQSLDTDNHESAVRAWSVRIRDTVNTTWEGWRWESWAHVSSSRSIMFSQAGHHNETSLVTAAAEKISSKFFRARVKAAQDAYIFVMKHKLEWIATVLFLW